MATSIATGALGPRVAAVANPESQEAIKKAIADVTSTPPKVSDVNRVRARLAEGGWPLAKPEQVN